MEKTERLWLGFLVFIALAFNVITLSPVVPWQSWMLWSLPTPDQRVAVTMENYQIKLPPQGIQVAANQFVEFTAASKDVTYGFGVFRSDGKMVFQMQVLPGRENKIVWKFDAPGTYDIRSTEYSGPKHPGMFVKNAIMVSQ